MDEIIYLEADEEITSVIDKLQKLEGKSVSLVVPKGASLLQSVVNLKILKKEAENLDKEIALVTQDRIGRNLASQVGLSVYDKISSPRPVIQAFQPEPETTDTIELDLSEKKPLKTPPGIKVHRYDEGTGTPPPPTHVTAKPLSAEDYKVPPVGKPQVPGKKKAKIIIISIILAVVALGLFFIFYPKAIVTLALNSEPLEESIEIVVDDSINQPKTANDSIPGELLEVENQSNKTFSATGTKDVGEKAKGTIKVSNGTGDEQYLPAGTEFKSSAGLSFISTGAVTVPKATASVDSSGNVVKKSGTADAGVEAKEPGDKYNIGAGSFTVTSNSKVSADSTSAMSGGVTKQIKIVSQDDINNAKTSLQEDLKNLNHQDLTKKAGKNTVIDTGITDEIASFSATKNVLAEADSFQANLKLKSKTLAFSEEAYREMIVSALQKKIPTGKDLILSSADAITTTGEVADYSLGIMKLSGKVKSHLVAKIDDNNVKTQIKNKTRQAAQDSLKVLPGVSSVEITLRPSWWLKKIPSLEKNIIIKKEIK